MGSIRANKGHLGPLRVNKGHLGGLVDKVFMIRERHHRIRRQILRENDGLIFLIQS